MAVLGRRTVTGYVRVQVGATMGWGVDLHTSESGAVHESVADKA